MLERLMPTDENLASPLLRLFLGIVFFPHGAQKLLGWFGGHGLEGTIAGFTAKGIPSDLAYLVVAGETLAMIALALGLFTRLCAFGTTAIMVGAIVMVHAPNGFFMNWGGAPHGEGYEFHLLALSMAAALVVAGGGFASVDAWLARKLAR